MRGKFLVGVLIFFSGLGIFLAQQAQTPEGKTSATPVTPTGPPVYKITAEDSARRNPVRFTEASVARGKRIYNSQCAMCHGENADGKGEVAAEMQITPADFTKAETLKNQTDGDLFAILDQGSHQMPGQEKRLKERHKWDLINFLKASGGKVPEKSTGPEPDENVLIVPQDPQR
jgi:mono/diheme cytochrome c family protein